VADSGTETDAGEDVNSVRDAEQQAHGVEGRLSLDVADGLSHDERQALVSGLAGIPLEDGNSAGVSIAGVPPMLVEGTWRGASSSTRRSRLPA